MRYVVSVGREGGERVDRCPELPDCESRANTVDEAVARLRSSIIFWLEACPCDQTADVGLVLEVREA